MMKRRTFILATLTFASLASPVSAQTYPARPVTIIVPFAAGGPTDTTARQIGVGLGAKLGQTIVVENVSGGASTIGTARAAQAAPDGYTLLLHNLAISANVSLYPKATFNVERDLVPIVFVNNNPLVLVGRKTLPANNLAELTAWMKNNQVRFAYPGTGTTGHLATALFAQALGVKVDFIPYRGAAPAMQDITAGHVDLFFATTQQTAPSINAGTIKAYGVTAKERMPQLPQVLSFVQELGPKLEILFWHALFAPAKTPKPVQEKLNAVMQEVLTDPQLIATWAKTGVGVYPKDQLTQEAAVALLKSEIKRWGEVIRENNITPQ
jgi:tripartite-type tricarboxylate transporter receptor subunit TctC